MNMGKDAKMGTGMDAKTDQVCSKKTIDVLHPFSIIKTLATTIVIILAIILFFVFYSSCVFADNGINLLKAFTVELNKTYGIPEGELKVEIMATYPKNLSQLNPVFLPIGRIPLNGGVVTIMTTYAGPNGKPFRGSVTMRLRRLQSVLVATNAIKGGEIVEGRVAVEERDAFGLPSDFVSNINDALGKVARIPISKGGILCHRFIIEPVLIKRGDPVTIIVANGEVEVTATGEALMDGQFDSIIRIKNLDSQKIIAAKVIEKGKVAIELP